MPGIIIFSIPSDYHSVAVQWAITKLGGRVENLYLGDIPDQCDIEFMCDTNTYGPKLNYNTERGSIDLLEYTVVWNRRQQRPYAPVVSHPHDKWFIEKESIEHLRSITALLELSCLMVNPISKQIIADRKMVQIVVARQVGFKVPDSLISNNARSIISFLGNYDRVVTKSYRPYAWKNSNEIVSCMTSDISTSSVDDVMSFSVCPTIYQRRITRHFECRLIMFGHYVFAAEMSFAEGEATVDIRAGMINRPMRFKVIAAPAEVVDKCEEYMALLSLKFAAFDFLIDDKGNWTFLECNEAGQFLFLEQALPELMILDCFSRWLMSIGGVSVCTNETISVRNFENEVSEETYKGKAQRHKKLGDRRYIAFDESL